ncbi:hypothetical protein O6H91_09G021200 [Diphasiastrum complanatum]|uniref:Uncharacterized protein n=1 Tax=Diphasiastrum complanatum TaxID=34168 RepID=A0ACC2CM12_DIPCM|nr:hypothetical protein O6H91_09G021200 [Diphasiastrum complanatum]
MAFKVARIHERSFIGGLEADGAPSEMVDLSSSSAGSSVMSPLPFSSMVEFSGCSTETESSEDDDFFAGLAEQMAHSMLDDSEDEYTKTDYVGMKSGSINRVNIWGSPTTEHNDQTEVNWSPRTPIGRPASFMYSSLSLEDRSPPVLPFSMESRHWDVMSSAARDHSGLRKEERIPTGATLQFGDQIPSQMHSSKAHSWQCSPSSRSVQPPQLKNFPEHSYFFQDHSSVPMSSSVGLNDRISETRPAHHSQKQRDLDQDCKFLTNLPSKQGTSAAWARHSRPHPHQKSMGNCKIGHVKGGLQNQSKNGASHWRPMHPITGGSGMRAVFLGGSGACKESSGTGVFLPLSANYQKRKPVCSTVLLPSRIVQVLNLQVDDLGCQPLPQSRNTASASLQLAESTPQATTAHHKLKSSSGKARGSNEQLKTFSACSHLHQPSMESRLPSDWKY